MLEFHQWCWLKCADSVIMKTKLQQRAWNSSGQGHPLSATIRTGRVGHIGNLVQQQQSCDQTILPEALFRLAKPHHQWVVMKPLHQFLQSLTPHTSYSNSNCLSRDRNLFILQLGGIFGKQLVTAVHWREGQRAGALLAGLGGTCCLSC